MTRIAALAFCLLASFTAPAQDTRIATATFAGGCFWCVEEAFDKLPGIVSTVSGYMGGTKKNPTYEEVSSGRTGHTEVVQVKYDPKKVSYEQLLQHFWINHDPTTIDSQFATTARSTSRRSSGTTTSRSASPRHRRRSGRRTSRSSRRSLPPC